MGLAIPSVRPSVCLFVRLSRTGLYVENNKAPDHSLCQRSSGHG